jgi:hypothetical protein
VRIRSRLALAELERSHKVRHYGGADSHVGWSSSVHRLEVVVEDEVDEHRLQLVACKEPARASVLAYQARSAYSEGSIYTCVDSPMPNER